MNHIRQLLHVCEEGNATVTQSILDKGTDVNATDEDEVTALQVAAANGHEHLVRLLLMRGAALDKANSLGWTPLLLACRHGHVNVVALLLQNQADLNAKTRLGANAITLAARGGHLQTCKLLVEAGIDLQPSTGIGGSTCEFTALMVSAHRGHDTVVRYLLDRGCDVNHRTPSMGIGTLMLAALNGYVTTSQVLIEGSADPNLTNVNDHTPLQIATQRKKREVQGYLDRKTSNKHKLADKNVKPDIIDAAKAGDIDRIREILDSDVTQRDASSSQDGATPLMFAAMTGRLDIAQLLIERGCDINKQDLVSGWTALMQATYHGKRQVAKLLINAGAEVLIPARNGCTAFDLASLIDDMDTDLYRLMATKAVKIANAEAQKKAWGGKGGKQNGSLRGSTNTLNEQLDEEKPRSGLKAWWNRMSNRFRNLKMGRTSSNRLAPLPPVSESGDTDTLKAKHSPKRAGSVPKRSVSADPLTSAGLSTVSSYDTIMSETRKSASVYTLGINSPSAHLEDGNLKPVLPPFLPPPTFDTDRPRMPPTTSRRSVSSLGSASTLTQMSTRPIIPPMKLLKSYSVSSQNLAPSPTSPAPSVKFGPVVDAEGPRVTAPRFEGARRSKSQTDTVINFTVGGEDQSPSSSTGASGISGSTLRSKGPSSASSSTLTAGSDHLNRSGNSGLTTNGPLFTRTHRPPSYPPSVSTQSRLFTTPSSLSSGSTSEVSAIMPNKQARAKSQSSSKESASTLTPSHSPAGLEVTEADSGKGSEDNSSGHNKVIDAEETDPGGILKKLSLEQYQPIFEEQEVDMEAFLTLTDQDLTELGISHTDSRRQILTVITELSSGKGRERQHLQDTMTSFTSTTSRTTDGLPDQMDYADWSLTRDGTQPAMESSKTRAS